MKKILLLIAFLLVTATTFSQIRKRESYYQKEFANAIGGETEFVLEDRTRVDVLTDIYSIEVDFASKWAESIGQSLHYAKMTGKKAGVLLIVKGNEEERFIKRLMGVAAQHGITVWIWDYTNNTWGIVDIEFKYIY